jgi:hypothetical protein
MVALMQFNPAQFQWVETAGIVLMLVVVGSAIIFALLKGIIVLGTTCDLLLEAEREKTKLAQAESIQARKDLARVANEFNHNLERILAALLDRSPNG